MLLWIPCIANGRKDIEVLKRVAAYWEPVFVNTVFYRVNSVCRILAYARRVAVCHVSYPLPIV